MTYDELIKNAKGIIVSNHGGRVLDQCAAELEDTMLITGALSIKEITAEKIRNFKN